MKKPNQFSFLKKNKPTFPVSAIIKLEGEAQGFFLKARVGWILGSWTRWPLAQATFFHQLNQFQGQFQSWRFSLLLMNNYWRLHFCIHLILLRAMSSFDQKTGKKNGNAFMKIKCLVGATRHMERNLRFRMKKKWVMSSNLVEEAKR